MFKGEEENPQIWNMLCMSMAATKGFDHVQFYICSVLQQFGFEDVANFSFTFIILIMKMVPKLKFELSFLF